MKKLSKMIIIALGLTLLASGVASAKMDVIMKAPITTTTK
jgi:outer membrane murein-binding lipoprotein Lpp